MTDADTLRVENIELRAAPLIEEAGGDPRMLAAAVRETARENAEFTAEAVVAILQVELPDAFHKASPDSVDLDALADPEKADFIDKHGLSAFVRAVARQSKKRRAQYQRAQRGF